MVDPTYIRIHTDSPLESMWVYFRRFEVIEAVAAQSRTADPMETARAVRDCVRQSREYYRSAHSADLLTKPVLLYYGMVSLGKLILLLDQNNPVDMNGTEEIERKGGHGLRQLDPPSVADGHYPLEEGTVLVTADGKPTAPKAKGIFPQLALRVCPDGVQAWLSKEFKVKDLLRAVPQLDLQMRQSFGDLSGFSGLWVRHVTYSDGLHRLEVCAADGGVESREQVEERIAYLDLGEHPVSITGSRDFPFAIGVGGSHASDLIVREERTPHGYTTPPPMFGKRFDSILAHYMVMYALSIVARYKPHRWADILEGRGSNLLPVVEEFILTSERWWPNLVLNYLTRSYVCFAPTMFW